MEMICRGDRGSSAIWYDKKSKKSPNKAYLIGVAFLSHYRCGKSKMTSNKEIFGTQLKKKSVRPSRFVAIPGTIFQWIRQKGGQEMKIQINNCRLA